ncbi:MAG: OB-fold domain-containing protein [Proteobacteria bacterium]|nr:OB-fold domain-containing protein [Pseudomonadota bacterium]
MGADVELVSPFVLEYAYKRSTGPVIGRFLTSLRDGRIEGVRTAAGRVLCPPVEYDPDTGEDVQDFVEVGPCATVLTWTWIDAPLRDHPVQVPFAFALVQLEGADTSMLHAVCAPREDMATGMRVRAVFRDERVGSITDIAHFEIDTGVSKDLVPNEATEPITRFKAPTRLEYVVAAGATTAEFLRGVLRRELIGRRCPSCEKIYLPPRGSCPTCGVRTTELVPMAQKGTVTTFSVIRIPFEGQVLEPPYAAAHVLLDGGDTPLLHIVGDVDVDLVRMGMRVEAVWAEQLEPTLASVRYFRPIDEPDVPYAEIRGHV